jgi:hypothetical protein
MWFMIKDKIVSKLNSWRKLHFLRFFSSLHWVTLLAERLLMEVASCKLDAISSGLRILAGSIGVTTLRASRMDGITPTMPASTRHTSKRDPGLGFCGSTWCD